MTMRIAYLDCFSGISGDMLLGALLDLGFPVTDLEARIKTLGLDNFVLSATPEQRMHLTGTRFSVRITKPDSTARSFSDIRGIIESSTLPGDVKQTSVAIFQRLAEAEAKIHNQPVDQVHFHEVGAVDSIIDIVGSVVVLNALGIEKVFSSPLPLGSGFVSCRHGTIPVPAPATMALLKDVPVYGTGIPHELVTPTGAAIVTTLAEAFGPLPPLSLSRIGYGVGSREYAEQPNMLRIVLGTKQAPSSQEMLMVIETTIDDMNPEFYDHVMDLLFERGALDVFMTPIQMKKNRPATLFTVLAPHTAKPDLVNTLLQETSSTGLRFYPVERQTLVRSTETVATAWGDVRIKSIVRPDGTLSVTPEYDDCKKIACKHKIPLNVVYKKVMEAAQQN